MSVAQKIHDEAGAVIPPGTTGPCPACRETTFTVAPCDDLGQCDACGLRLLSNDRCPPSKLSLLRGLLAELAIMFFLALWRASGRISTNAQKFLIGELGLREELLRGYYVGLVPEGLDEEALVLSIPEESACDECPRPRDTALMYLSEFKTSAGGVAIPHTDTNHLITGFRVMDLKGRVRDHRLLPGVFHSFAYPATAISHPQLADRIVVVQDEMQWLQTQLALVAAGFNPLRGAATGPLANADIGVLDALGGEDARRVLVVGNASPHPAILSLPAAVQKSLTIDGHEFANGIGERKPEQIIADLEEAHARARIFYRPLPELAKQVFVIRKAHMGVANEFVSHRAVADIILRDLLRRGELLTSGGNGYWMSSETRQVIPMGARDQSTVALLAKMGLVASEGIFRFLCERLATEAQTRGREVVLRRFGHWDEETGKLYVDLRNGSMLVLDGQNQPTTVQNGADGVLFLALSNAEPFAIQSPPPATSIWADTILDKINFAKDGYLHSADRRFLLTIHLLSYFFASIFPTRPTTCFVGVKGSGKSMTCRATGKVLIGSGFNVASVSESRRDLETYLTNSFVAMLDNADDSPDKVNDLLAVAATGGQITRRELFTTNRLSTYSLDCFLSITSRTPKFRRDDVADRTIPFRVERMEKFIAENVFLALLEKRRDSMWSELLDALQATVGLLKQTPRGSKTSELRIADYADFGFRLCAGLGLAPYWDYLMRCLVRDQAHFALSGHGIYECLKLWLASGHFDEEVETGKLYEELSAIAEKKSSWFEYKNAQSFGQYLVNLVEPLKEFYEINIRTGHARSRHYTFKRKASALVVGEIPESIPPASSDLPPFIASLHRYASESLADQHSVLNKEGEARAAQQRRAAAEEAARKEAILKATAERERINETEHEAWSRPMSEQEVQEMKARTAYAKSLTEKVLREDTLPKPPAPAPSTPVDSDPDVQDLMREIES